MAPATRHHHDVPCYLETSHQQRLQHDVNSASQSFQNEVDIMDEDAIDYYLLCATIAFHLLCFGAVILFEVDSHTLTSITILVYFPIILVLAPCACSEWIQSPSCCYLSLTVLLLIFRHILDHEAFTSLFLFYQPLILLALAKQVYFFRAKFAPVVLKSPHQQMRAHVPCLNTRVGMAVRQAGATRDGLTLAAPAGNNDHFFRIE